MALPAILAQILPALASSAAGSLKPGVETSEFRLVAGFLIAGLAVAWGAHEAFAADITLLLMGWYVSGGFAGGLYALGRGKAKAGETKAQAAVVDKVPPYLDWQEVPLNDGRTAYIPPPELTGGKPKGKANG